MKLKRIAIASILVLLLVVIMVAHASSVNSSWHPIDQDAFKVISSANGVNIAYRILEDENKSEIVSLVTEIGENDEQGALKDNWQDIRSDYIKMLDSFKEIGSDMSFNELPAEPIIVSFSNGSGDQTWLFYKMKNNGKTVFIPEEIEDLPFEFVYDIDSEVYLIATETGLWQLDTKSNLPIKLSYSSYDNKSYDDLLKELNEGQEYKGGLFWNTHAVISPDGSKVVYSSNKDCTERKGYSLWLYDFDASQEHILAGSTGEYYTAIGWLNSDTVLCSRSADNNNSICVVTGDGAVSELFLGSDTVDILCTHEELIAFTPDISTANEICFAQYNINSGDVSVITKLKLNGVLRGNGSFDNEGNQFAILYAPENDETNQGLYVFDLRDETGYSVETMNSNNREIISYFSWLNKNSIFINIAKPKEGLLDESSWIYEL